MAGRTRSEFRQGLKEVREPSTRVISERVARAAARALVAANHKLGVESDAKTKRLAGAN